MGKGNVVGHALLSVAVGAAATVGVLFLVLLTDPAGCGAGTPLLERHPFAWVLAWPELLTGTKSLETALTGNALLYAALTFFVLRRRAAPAKLP